MFLEFEQDGSTVTGQFCESFGNDDCHALTGRVEGQELTFEYHFASYTVTATLEIGSTLKGTFFSTKCGCEVPVELFAIP